ncbi:DUF4839 domain-containing protein [Mumia sp. DW29H23]|uniref:DUF4839 domain-containing protein n=1 Tax=Mumia sp. DW29H23 TaxID=3421241 RepID=UPI003D691CF4
MPDVTGQKLDVAYDKIKNAGFEDKDKVKIEGGGTFGVVMEGNWTVCEQEPTAGETISGETTLTVDRSCDDGKDDEPSDETSEDPDESPSTAHTPTAVPTPQLPAILTTKNNADLKALLALGDNCSNKVAKFARTYAGKTIEFSGSILAMQPHGNYETRFDFLIGAGDFDPNSATGPSFQFRDKNTVYDLHLEGKNIPEYVEVGQNYTFTAEVGEYNRNTCLFQLTPIETRTR